MLYRKTGLLHVTARCGGLDCGPHTIVRTAPADIRHCAFDVRIRRLGCALEQRHGGHDHSGLAEATLWHVERHPRFLNWMRPIGGKAFDRYDLRTRGDTLDRQYASAGCSAID